MQKNEMKIRCDILPLSQLMVLFNVRRIIALFLLFLPGRNASISKISHQELLMKLFLLNAHFVTDYVFFSLFQPHLNLEKIKPKFSR